MPKFIYVVLALMMMLLGGFTFNYFKTSPQPEHALYYQEARVLKPFSLTDHLGQDFDNAKLLGKWSWLFLGYTSCPDVCPTTLQKLGFIYKDMQAIADNSQVMLVTADPKRDTLTKLKQYIGYFNPEFIALRGEHGDLFPFARNLGLMYAISGEEDDYLVDHSASLVLINPDGNIAAIIKPEQAVGKIASFDTDKLLSDYQKIVALY